MKGKQPSQECSVCGELQLLSGEALAALRDIQPDAPIICASCAVDRKGSLQKRASQGRSTRAPSRKTERRVPDYEPRDPRPDASEEDWLPAVGVESDLTMVDLFCGPGGFSTGFEWAGFRSLAGVDVHEPSLRTFDLAHPSAEAILCDIRNLEASQLAEAARERSPDVMTAGIPCEGFSRSNRNRLAFIDARNFLFVEFLRMVEELAPRAVVVENVKALTSHSKGFFRDQIVAGIEALGYECHMKVLNALDYGVPQRRQRVIFVGLPPSTRWAWPRPSHGVDGDFPVRSVADALADLPDISSGEETSSYTGEPLNPYQLFLRGDQGELLNHVAPKHPQATIDRIANTDPGQPMYSSFKQRIRLHPDEPSPTVVSGGIRPQFAYGHPWRPRGLTIRERARLQSFPDWYSFEGGVTQGRVQTGDAVPPLMAWRIAEQIRGALSDSLVPERGVLGEVDEAQLSLLEA